MTQLDWDALLGAAINRALQPRLSIAQLCWLVG